MGNENNKPKYGRFSDRLTQKYNDPDSAIDQILRDHPEWTIENDKAQIFRVLTERTKQSTHISGKPEGEKREGVSKNRKHGRRRW